MDDIMEFLRKRDLPPRKDAQQLSVTFQEGSQASERHPDRNEDALKTSTLGGYAVVCDGVGGSADGAAASKLAVDIISETLTGLPPVTRPSLAKSVLESSFMKASHAISENMSECATTVVAAKLAQDEYGANVAVVGSVGDSRAYLYRGGRLQLITEDDSVISRFPISADEKRRISQQVDAVQSQRDVDKLSGYGRELFQQRNRITQHLGHGRVTPHLYEVGIKEGDLLLLTTDGIHDNLTPAEIERALRTGGIDLANSLVRQAQERSRDRSHVRAKPDDITAVIAQLTKGLSTPEATRLHEVVHDLSGGKAISLPYQGRPIQLQLSRSGAPLEIGRVEDLNVNIDLKRANVDFLILQRAIFEASKATEGFKGLRDGETVEIGKLNPGRFALLPTVSRHHVLVERDGLEIGIRDLDSTNGTRVKQIIDSDK